MTLHVRIRVPAFPAALEAVAEGLVRVNIVLLDYAVRRGVEVPALYDSGVRYVREPKGREWWETAQDLLSISTTKSGDCEDLASFRAAELRYFEGDDDACVRIVRTRRGSFHAIVQRGDGETEDPSRILLDIEADRKRATR